MPVFFFPWAGVEKQNPTFYLKHQVLSTWVWMIRTAASWLGLAPVTSRVGLCQTKIDVKVGRVIASWEKSNRAVYYKPAREIPEDIRPTLDALGNGNRAKPSHAAFPQHPGPPTPGLFSGWASSFTPGTAGKAAWWTCYSYPSRCRWAAYAEMAIKPSNVCRQDPAILPRLILENVEMGYMEKVKLAPRMLFSLWDPLHCPEKSAG